VVAELGALGLPSWRVGTVGTGDRPEAGGHWEQGAKGVDGGAVRLVGSYAG
jgi:phosphoribosylformylglycinamidine cyclo-ligase